MKKILFSAAMFMYIFSFVWGQISISQTDMPVVNQVYQRYSAGLGGVDYTTTGPAQTWDYRSLTPVTLTTDSFNDPATTPLVYQLVFNNFFNPNYDATHAHPGAQLALPSLLNITITDVYNFYKNGASGFSLVGFGATINGIPTPIMYSDVDEIYQFPLQYNDVDNSTYYFEVNIPSIGFWKQKGDRENIVDGWGTLLLPDSVAFDVIRVKTRVDIVDSVRLESLGFTIPIPRTEYQYKFFANGQGTPVLQMNTVPNFLGSGEILTSVQFLYTPFFLSTQTEIFPDLKIFPNPSSDVVCVNGLEENTTVQIVDVKGCIVGIQSLNSGSNYLSVRNLSSGTYYLLFTSDKGFATRTLVKN